MVWLLSLRKRLQPYCSLQSQVDSNDRERIWESKEILFDTLFDDLMATPYLLVYANKQDLPNAMSPSEVLEQMGLHTLPKEITWHFQPCCATTADGLIEGLNWLASVLVKHDNEMK